VRGASWHAARQSSVALPDLGRLAITNDFISDHEVADRVTDYVAKRLRFGQDGVDFEVTQEARDLVIGDLILVRYPALFLVDEVMEVATIEKPYDRVRVRATGWDPSIYEYEPGTLPQDPDDEIEIARIPRPPLALDLPRHGPSRLRSDRRRRGSLDHPSGRFSRSGPPTQPLRRQRPHASGRVVDHAVLLEVGACPREPVFRLLLPVYGCSTNSRGSWRSAMTCSTSSGIEALPPSARSATSVGFMSWS
jgi:hypothetical protein